jgi:hypothetical protein
MAIIISAGLTAVLVSPVFMLAGWFKPVQGLPVRAQFNFAHGRRF